MRPSILFWLPLLLFFTGATHLRSQQQPKNRDFIEMCGVKLFIGQSQETVLKGLAGECSQFSTSDDGTSWLIASKSEPHRGVGQLWFEHNKLILVSKKWETAPKAPIDVGEALYFAGIHFIQEGRNTGCGIGTIQDDSPDGTYRRFTIVCGRKELRVEFSRHKVLGTIVEVAEYLR